MDASDVRYADTFKLFGKDTIWGIDANNTPTVEDPWNTTPAFGWPQISSTIAPAFAPPLTHLESGLGQIVGGAGAYVFWNDMLYADFTAYKGLPVRCLQAFNDGNSTTDAITNVAPYWRVRARAALGTALPDGRHVRHVSDRSRPAASTGSAPTTISTSASTRNIQYDGDQYSLTVKLTDIMEWQKLNATTGSAGRRTSTTRSTASRPTRRSSGITPTASASAISTSPARATAICTGRPPRPCMPNGSGAFPNSYLASPYGDGLILDLAYIPFAHGARLPIHDLERAHRHSVHQYLHLYGGTNNFDGSFLGGTHNASGNNSVFAYAWLAF